MISALPLNYQTFRRVLRLYEAVGCGASAFANLFCRASADQTIPPDPYTVPNEADRRLMAELILEEAFETISALGFTYSDKTSELMSDGKCDLDKMIDGCCDLKFVCDGALAGFGVPPEPHMNEVCRANMDKFPGGVATKRADGKYLKPPGWKGPDHAAVRHKVMSDVFGLKTDKTLSQRLKDIGPLPDNLIAGDKGGE